MTSRHKSLKRVRREGNSATVIPTQSTVLVPDDNEASHCPSILDTRRHSAPSLPTSAIIYVRDATKQPGQSLRRSIYL